MNKLEVEWTGSYPCLCSGEWVIRYNGNELDIPREYKHSHMNTFGEYEYLADVIEEEFETYTSGLDVNEWIDENQAWITKMFNNINVDISLELLEELYEKIHHCDWRESSCGGCI